MSPKVSVFANVSPASFIGHFTNEDVLKTIRSTKFKPSTYHLRTLSDPEEARIYKAGKQDEKGHLTEPGHFVGAAFSGRFEGGKKAQHLVQHSGQLCMDIDGLSAEQLTTLVKQLRADEFTRILFVSPSGNGLKWVVRIDLQHPDEHKAFFTQLADYLHGSYGLTRKEDVARGEKPQIDPQCKNVDRLCFLPYDPDAFHNPGSEVMPLLIEYKSAAQVPPVTKQDEQSASIEEDTHERIRNYIQQLQVNQIDLTASYEDWVKVGLSLASLGESGRLYFHQVSQLNPKYEPRQTDAKFTELLQNRNGQVNVGTFLHLCQQALDDHYQDAKQEGHDGSAPTWENPKPLEITLLSVLSVSHSMIPEHLRPWLIDISNRMKCPLDFVASATIVMLSSLIGTRLSIKPKFYDDWTITPNLWGAAIGDPSTMKTPSIAEVFKPLNRLITESRNQYEQEMISYEAELATYEAQKKVYSAQELDRLKGKKSSHTVSFPEPVRKPTERRYMTNDATVEKLADLLNENPTGLLQFRDELTGLLAGWERNGREEDRAFYLEAWNGSGSKTVDRIGRGTIHVKNLCVSLFGGIQPQKLVGYLRAATDYENDGFVQRLQLAVYPDRPQWAYVDEYPNKEARDNAFRLIQQLVDSDFSSIAYNADDYNRYPYTRFDSDAQEIFKQWLIDWETNVLPNESGLLLEHFTKYRSLMPSLALIFHVVNSLGLPAPAEHSQTYLVSASAAQMAVEWCRYLQSHARRIYGLLDIQQVEAAKSLLAHLKAGHLKDGFSGRDVVRNGWANLSKSDSVESALTELVAHNWLLEIQPPASTAKGGRRLSPHYLIHPIIIQKV